MNLNPQGIAIGALAGAVVGAGLGAASSKTTSRKKKTEGHMRVGIGALLGAAAGGVGGNFLPTIGAATPQIGGTVVQLNPSNHELPTLQIAPGTSVTFQLPAGSRWAPSGSSGEVPKTGSAPFTITYQGPEAQFFLDYVDAQGAAHENAQFIQSPP